MLLGERRKTLSKQTCRYWCAIAIWQLACGAALAALDQDRWKFSGQLEFYHWNSKQGTADKVSQRARWLQLQIDFSDSARLVGGEFTTNQIVMADETYLEFGNEESLKLGKIRPALGFSDWNEWYTGLISAPIVRRGKFSNGFSLQSFGSGVEASGGTPQLQYKLAFFDGSLRRRQILWDTPDRFAARLQTYQAGVILGLNGLFDLNRSHAHATNLYGVDAWWTTPQLQVRGEYFWDGTQNAKGKGAHIDGFLKPFGWAHTTLVARAQNFTGANPAPKGAELYTVGLKQDLSRQLSLDINYSFGPVSNATKSDRGLKVQLLSKIRF